jgi:hypothetical protein
MDIGDHHLWWLGRNVGMEGLIMNQPAFPLHNHGAQTLGMHLSGMTLREYFAAKAMQSFLSHFVEQGWDEDDLELVAETSYRMADAMLKSREA